MEKQLSTALEAAFRDARSSDAPLHDRLRMIADAVRALSPPFADAVERLVARLQVCGVGATAPAVGEPMPPFALPDDEGRIVRLDTLLDKGPVVVAFHRGHWCPYCRLAVAALAEIAGRIEADGASLVAISPERQPYTARMRAEAGAGFPILTDMDNGYALLLNLAFRVDEEMGGMIATAGVDLPSYQGNPSWTLPVPATFIVGSDGRIAARYIDPDYRTRMTIEDLVTALHAAARPS